MRTCGTLSFCMKEAADAKGIRIESVIDPRATPISGDPDRLQQVLWNLASNAVKFTNRGGKPWEPEYLVAINGETCIGCGRCFKVCGRDVMTLKGINEDGEMIDLDDDDDEVEKKVMVMNDDGACIGCGACARVCPTNCQTHAAA